MRLLYSAPVAIDVFGCCGCCVAVVVAVVVVAIVAVAVDRGEN